MSLIRKLRRNVMRARRQKNLFELYREYVRQEQSAKRRPVGYRIWRDAQLKAAGQLPAQE